MDKNQFSKIISKNCPYCNQFFEDSRSQYANHVRWCKKNPRRKELDRSTKEKLKKINRDRFLLETKEFEVVCAKCGKKFKVREKIDKFPKKEKYYCSKSCANSHKKSENSRKKISEKLKKYYSSRLKRYKHICKGCGKEFENKKKNSIFCSNDCRIQYKKKNSKRSLFEQYRIDCSFNFNLKDFPKEFDFSLIEKYGWYKAKNHGNNLIGVSRDHMVSIKYGFEHNIDPKIISHPANCKLMVHSENIKKYSRCSLTLEELLIRIEEWNKKYNL